MNKKITAAAAALLAVSLITSCGQRSDPAESDADISSQDTAYESTLDSVSQSEGTEVSTVSMPVVTEAEPESTAAAKPYLSEIMFVGDDMCAGLADNSEVDGNMIFAENGIAASDVLDHSFENGNIVDFAAENKPMYIYVWLGINDLSYCNDYAYYVNMKSVITALNEASPDSIIAVMSLPPVASVSSWDNDVCGGGASYDISVYQDTIEALVADLGLDKVVCIDSSSVLRNDSGRLDEGYDSGDGLHINESGYDAVCRYINDNRFFNESMGDLKAENMPVVTESPDSAEDADITESETDVVDESKPAGAEIIGKDDLKAERAPYYVSSPKVCYLTFDDGPSDNSEAILDILKENDVKATFFVVGWCVDGREDILQRMVDEGHTVGIHTYSHDYEEIYESKEAYVDDFEKVYNVIYETVGVKPWLFRYPGGSYNSFNKDVADDIITEMNGRGFTYFDWSCATSDATVGATYNSCVENFKDTLSSDYETVLIHDSKELTVEYLPEIIDYAKAEGYKFETLDSADPIHF
ncbi:MAG: polysaccharide deacetylase family protein [Oscillospiraceae bacterium]